MSVKILIILGILVSSIYIYYTIDIYKDELYKEFYVTSVESISHSDQVVAPKLIEKKEIMSSKRVTIVETKKDINKYDIESEIEMALKEIIPSKIIEAEGK